MKYLKKFNQHLNYSSYLTNSLYSQIKNDSVSYCVHENEVHYNKWIDPYNGYEYVDLGLQSGVKWATMNVGASKPEEEGFFFSWGNVEGHNLNGQGTYDFGTSNDTDPYKSSSGASLSGNIATGDAYDMARANMGAPWRLPTKEEFQELYDNTDSTWTTQNGVAGKLFTSKTNGNSIFFPAAGHYHGSSHYDEGSYGYYWSSVLFSATRAHSLLLSSTGVGPKGHNYRYYGYPVRAVAD